MTEQTSQEFDARPAPVFANRRGWLRSRRWPLFIILLAGFVVLMAIVFRPLLFGLLPGASQAPNSLMPVISPPSGSYLENVQVEIGVPNPAAEIYFTLDGSMPSLENGVRYEKPLQLEASIPNVAVLRAGAILPDGQVGPVTSASYVLGVDSSLPIMSLIIDPKDFWDEERGIYVNYLGRGREWERPIDITYIDADKESGIQVGAGIRMHGGWSRFFSDKKSMRLFFRDYYGDGLLDYPLFKEDSGLAQNQTRFDRIVLHNAGKDLLLFRNQLVARLAWQMGGNATRSQPVLLFINGRPWGIYQLRERADKRFVEETYGIEGTDLSDTPNNIGQQSEEQLAVDTVHWENFIAFVEDHDLSQPENYAYVQSQIDIPNFVDYYLLQMYAANVDWPHHNVHQFRSRAQGGRWEWIFWDTDFGFGLSSHQMVEHILHPNHPLGERSGLLVNKLMENPEFSNLFITRAADLLNTTMSTDNVVPEIDILAAEIGPDINYEIERWSISADWHETVQSLRNFATERPDIMRQHFVESFGLAGVSLINFARAEEENGWIVVNDLPAESLPWHGTFFQGTNIRLRAIPEAGYEFAGWEGLRPESLLSGDKTSNVITITIGANQEIRPRFKPLPESAWRPGDVTISWPYPENVIANQTNDIQIELRVNRPGGVDLRGWRLTDNDSLTAKDEGSLIFADDPLLSKVPNGATITIIAAGSTINAQQYPEDEWRGDELILYVGNGRIDVETDPWFNMGTKDNLVLLAPGKSDSWQDDIPIDFVGNGGRLEATDFGLPPSTVVNP
jgi:hypothetical protein